jgi:hypothetical protein
MVKPKNKKLYDSIIVKAKKKFLVWPSAYASGWVVKEYKKQGGKYSGPKPSKSTGLQRWFDEKWIDVCKLPKKISCGRPSINMSNWKKKYPYCRPSKTVNKSTPTIASKLTKTQINSRCKKKKSNPIRKISSMTKPSKSSRNVRKTYNYPNKPSKSRRNVRKTYNYPNKPSKSRRNVRKTYNSPNKPSKSPRNVRKTYNSPNKPSKSPRNVRKTYNSPNKPSKSRRNVRKTYNSPNKPTK